MKQSAYLSKSSLDFSDKDPGKKKPASKDYPNDTQLEEAEKSVIGHTRIGSNFDFTNFGLFFKHKASNSRSSNDSYASRVHIKKKSNETSSSKESTLKRMSSKDFSNLEELCENTTVITNPIEINAHSKKVSTEISLSKNLSEEGMDASHEDLTGAYIGKSNETKKMRPVSFYGIMKSSKEDKHEQEIMGTISKLGLSGDCEEQEKIETSICKDLKLPKATLNNEVIERIKVKALHHRRTSVSNNLNNTNTSMNNSSVSNLSSFNSIQSGQAEMRTNNTSVFNGSRKLNKTPSFNNQGKKEISDNNLLEPFRNSNSVLFSPFEPENSSVDTQAHIKESLIAQGPTSLLTKSITTQEPTKDNEKTAAKKKPNLSTIATDSTIDSDNLTTLTFNHHNNSFSTLFSGTSNSFNNSGKIDFNSPLRVDSGRLTENLHTVFNANLVNPQSVAAMPVQKSPFNLGPNLTNCYGGYGSGNNTDRSNSFSWNEEFVNSNFSSALGTPQGRQQQAFFNQNLNIAPPSFNIDHQYAHNIGPQTMRNRVNSSFAVQSPDLNQSVNQGAPSSSNERANTSSSGKESKSNSGKFKKKGQEPKDGTLFEIDVYKVDQRTTLMVKNIPNKYDLPLILQTIEKNHKGKFDFFYLPIDPRNKCNVGYAFINFIDIKYIKDFYNEFNAKKWEKFNSEKVCEIKYARIQGKKALMHHFQYSNVMNQQDKKLKPYVPADYDVQKIKDLVNKQKLESAGNGY